MTVHGTIVPVAGCALAALALTPAAAGAAAGELDPRRPRAAADDKRSRS